MAAHAALRAALSLASTNRAPPGSADVQAKSAQRVLSNGIDGNGRMIAFVYAGDHPGPDGSSVFVDNALVDQSVNALLLAAGHAYPAFYATLPATLRTHLAGISRAARAAQSAAGLWPRSTADPDGAAGVADLAALEQLVIWNSWSSGPSRSDGSCPT